MRHCNIEYAHIMILSAHFKTLNILHIFSRRCYKMEILLVIVAIIVVLGWFVWKDAKHDSSGSHPLDGATKNAVTNVLDVNNDGKVDLKDAVAAAEVVVEKTKKTAAKAKTKVKEVAKKTVAKAKAPAKKTAVKKPKK